MKSKPLSTFLRFTIALLLAGFPANATPGASLKTIYEAQKLISADREPGDLFGNAVSVSGNLAIIGAYAHDNGNSTGAAYIYAFDGVSWNQQAELTVADGNQFGQAVAISGNMALVGNPFDSSVGLDRGSAYVFTFDGTTWNQQAKLTASDGHDLGAFGISVALSGTTALVGSFGSGNQGAVYVFTFDGTAWSEQTKLTASDAEDDDLFGIGLSLSGNRALIGAYRKDDYTGAAYVFSSDGLTWSQEAELTALDGEAKDDFGVDVSLSGDVALVGAPGKNRAGAAYIFAFDGTAWSQQSKLQSPGHQPGAYFGSSVALSPEMALVGADTFSRTGAVFQFVFHRNTWVLRAQLLASDGARGDFLGFAVALSGNTVLVGADDFLNRHEPGAAYIFSLGRQD
jgi:hypothetical protein